MQFVTLREMELMQNKTLFKPDKVGRTGRLFLYINIDLNLSSDYS